MINLVDRKLNTLKALSCCVLAIMLLQGCGAERKEPYNPSVAGSSSSSSAVSVDSSSITQGTTTSGVIDHKEKSVNVMRDATEFYAISDNYVNINLEEPDFTNGQVVLIDMGNLNGCDQHLNFSSLSAQKAGTNAVKVKVNYSESVANTSGCSNVITRPYYFYYVKSRGPLMVEENIL